MLNKATTAQRAQTIKERTNLRDLIAMLLPGSLKRSATRYDQYFSPFRDDGRNASFTVYDDGYFDQVEGVGGTCIDFVMRLYGYSLLEAIDFLESYHGGNISAQPIITQRNSHPTPEAPPSDEWQQAMRLFINEAHERLLQTPPALAYLYDVRGLTDETIRKFKLGYNPGWENTTYRDADGIVRAAPGIVIPWEADSTLFAVRIRAHKGNLAQAMGVREDTLFDSKYISVRGSRQSAGLFNADALQTAQAVLLVEGEFDAMLAQQHSDLAVVTRGSAGAHRNFPQRWVNAIEQVGPVYSLLDNDDAGQKATSALSERLEVPLLPLQLPSGKDVSDYLLVDGGSMAAIEQQMAAAQPIIEGELTAAISVQTNQSPWWDGGVPDAWRSLMLNFFYNSTAVVIEGLHNAFASGALDPEGFTIKEAAEAIELSPRVIDAVFKSPDNVFLQKVSTVRTPSSPSFFAKTPPDAAADDGPAENVGGRPADLWRAMPLSVAKPGALDIAYRVIFEQVHRQVVARPTRRMGDVLNLNDAQLSQWENALSDVFKLQQNEQDRAASRAHYLAHDVWATRLDNPHSTRLSPEIKVTNTASYRAALLRGTVEAKEGGTTYSRGAMRQLIGTSDSNLDSMYRRAGVATEQRYVEVEIKNADEINRKIKQAQIENKGGYPLQTIIETQDGFYNTGYKADEAPKLIERELEAGHKVHIRLQLSSRQYIAPTEPVPEAPPPRPETTPEEVQVAPEMPAKAPARPPRYQPLANPILPERKRPKPTYGSEHDPEFIRRQLKVGIEMTQGLHWEDEKLMDGYTCTIIAPSLMQLLLILLGYDPRTVHEYAPFDPIAERIGRCNDLHPDDPLWDEYDDWLIDDLCQWAQENLGANYE